jgi:DNA-binding CsgD family transcriptional regulator
MPTFRGAQIQVGPSTSWVMRDAALILHRLGAGATVEELARLLGLDPDLLNAVLRDLAKRRYESDRLGKIFQELADGKPAAQIAVELGVAENEIADELEPTEQLTSVVCAVLMARAALPDPPLGAVGASGPLRTLPVRFPEQQYQRLKAWCEEHKFPMAVVVRGVVERFLDERRPAP